MWLKHVVLELAVTAFIALATIPELEWARWLTLGYTVLLLAVKAVALIGRNVLKGVATNEKVPSWFWHANYAVNVALVAADGWWSMTVGWALIWLFSILYESWRPRRPA